MTLSPTARPNPSVRRRLGISITFTQMDGVTDGGLGWAVGVYVPPGSNPPAPSSPGCVGCGWVALPPRGTMVYGPASCAPPPPAAEAARL